MKLLFQKYIDFLIITLIISICLRITKSENIFDVTTFGADTKGVKSSSDAINKAIDEAVKKGGGTVLFPKGTYLTGPIHLKSNITLSLDSGSIVKFSDNFDDYLPMVLSRNGGTELMNFSPPIYAYKQDNIAIRGKGTLDGQGKKWWDEAKRIAADYAKTGKRNSKYQEEFAMQNNLTELAKETTDPAGLELGFFRPSFIQPFECKNVLIEDVTVENSPNWNINPVFCTNVIIRGVKVRAPIPSPNTDGINPDSCKDVLITNVDIDVGDDCIAIKSGRDLQGRKIGRSTENVVISNSIMHRGHAGVTIGSEMSGGVRNVTVTDCVFNGTDAGFKIKSARGRGGVVENIHYKNVKMYDIVNDAIWLSAVYTTGGATPSKPEPFTDRTPTIRNIDVHNITVLNAKGSISITGLEESFIHNVTITDFDITAKSEPSIQYGDGIHIEGTLNKKKIKLDK